VFVKLDTNLDNWYMHVTLTMVKAPQAIAKELEPKELLKSGSLAAGLYPAGTARRKQMAEWFLEHFVMAPMQTTTIRASITAYSTAVGPSSAFRKFTTNRPSLRMSCPPKMLFGQPFAEPGRPAYLQGRFGRNLWWSMHAGAFSN
jgi:hypothetical protein